MLLSTLYALALTATASLAAAETSPLFLLASSEEAEITLEGRQTNPPAVEVQRALWRYLGSCPTKHYAVVVEERTLSFPESHAHMDSFIPEPMNPMSLFRVNDVDGQVNLIHVLNTILMDCLHHGVLEVKQLDTTPEALDAGIPVLDADVIRKSIIHARMPAMDANLSRDEYATMMNTRKEFTESILRDYFHGLDYTLIYIREEEVLADETAPERDDGAEKPLGGGY